MGRIDTMSVQEFALDFSRRRSLSDDLGAIDILQESCKGKVGTLCGEDGVVKEEEEAESRRRGNKQEHPNRNEPQI